MPQRPAGVNQLALALLLAGVLWLMLQLGFVPASLLNALGRWWPLLVIAGGIGLTVPRIGVVTGLVGGSALILVFALIGFTPNTAPAATLVIEQMPQGARAAEIELELGSPNTTIEASRDPTVLLHAEFSSQVLGSVKTNGREVASASVSPQRSIFNPFGPSGSWELTVPGTVPLALELRGGSGAAVADLSRAQLRDLDARGGSGALALVLPPTAFEGEVRGGSGSLEVSVPRGASADLELRLASGSTTVAVNEGADAVIELRTGSGRVELILPADAPIRLTIERDGSGNVTVRDYLTRRSGRGDTGVWESASFANGGRVIDIRITSAGSGAIVVR